MHRTAGSTRISTQLMLLFAGLALGIVLVLALVLNRLATARSEDELGHQFAEIALQTTDKLDRTLFERYREVRLLAIQAGLAGGGLDMVAKRRFLEEMQKTYPYYAWLGITGLDGRVLVSANGLLEGANVAARPWYRNAFKGKHLTDVHEAVLLSKLLQPAGAEPMRFIDIAFPYRDAAGQVAGVLGAHLSIDWARDIEQSVMRPLLTRRRLEALVVGPDTRVIIGPKELVGTRLATAARDPASLAQNGYAVQDFSDGKTYLVGYSRSQGHSFAPGLDWTVLVRQEVGEAYAPIARFRHQVIVIGLAIALLAAALAALLARRISQPLGVLAESARRIEAGEIHDIGDVDGVRGGYREIGMLRIALRSLIGKLQANESAMRQAARRKDEFLATLAHELRNPLAPISVAAELLALAPPDAAQQKRYGAMIGRQVRHMTDMIDDLLDVSRVTRGQVALDRSPTSLQEVVAEAVEQLMPLVASKKHLLVESIAPTPVTVLGDRTRLVQVVANLLNNAAKYTPEGGRIDLLLSGAGGRAQLTVRDNGIGMSPDLIEHAFELFTQETRKTDLSMGGLGVGLALSRQLVTLHEGELTVRSAGPGAGSEFTVSLPMLEDVPAAPPAADASAAPAMAGAGGLVLIVDDNVDAADTLGLLASSLGYEAQVEYGPLAALERARSRPPGVCLLDIGMPLMDGYELAGRLRALPGMKDALLVAVTGYSRDDDRRRALACGFDEHLAKPVDVGHLDALLAARCRPVADTV